MEEGRTKKKKTIFELDDICKLWLKKHFQNKSKNYKMMNIIKAFEFSFSFDSWWQPQLLKLNDAL